MWWRWAPVVLVLVVAGAVALWPRGDDTVGVHQPAHAVTAPTRVAPDLATARAKAGVSPCPAPHPGSPVSGPLAGVRADCLGDGVPVDVGAALAGRPTLINVWAPWCQPCREELPVLQAYASAPDAVAVLGVQVQSDPADGLELASLGVRFPSVHDGDGAVSTALRLPQYLPVSYLVLADGALRRVQPPTPFASPEQVRATVARYLVTGPTGHGR
ncbi:MAG: TlpA family protein disulfide reductase [Pseudonocardiales bacterium]|nr:TlpA family protein disulfide reductase [Pseudonocardiales bacterium]